MITRLGNAGDFQAIVPMLRQCRLRNQQLDPGLYELHPDAERRFHHWIGRMAENPRARLVVAEEDDRVIGFLYATIEQDAPIFLHDEFALIREWWVDPAFEQIPAASEAMIVRMTGELASLGVRQIRAHTTAGDEDARQIFRRCGFRAGACEMVREL
jgi:RimJ/RimL family protein N-acetyltransferase